MEGEAKAFVTVMTWIVASMTYVRFASATIEPGKHRFLALLPVIVLLPFLPWQFSSIYLRSFSGFFLTWLATFKLLLLSFGFGPLSPSLPLVSFIAISSLPVKLSNSKMPTPYAGFLTSFAIKLLLFAFPVSFYRYKNQIHPHMLTAIFYLHILIIFTVMFSFASFLGSLLGLDLEPQFDAPFKSTSLQEFWGRRWNLVVGSILRHSVYIPVRARLGAATGVMATFLVSGLMHEIVYYHDTLKMPNGEILGFFLVHGICTLAETKARKTGWWTPKPVVARVLVVGFVVVTGFRPLFLQPIVRSGVAEKSLDESVAVMRFLEEHGRYIAGWLSEIF